MKDYIPEQSYLQEGSKIFVAGRVVGRVEGGVFVKSIEGSKHILHKPRAIALSVESLQQAKALGADRISIRDRETGTVYFTDIAHFERYSFSMQRGGFEPQKALPLERWSLDVPEGPRNPPIATSTPEYTEPTLTRPQPVQLSFTGL